MNIVMWNIINYDILSRSSCHNLLIQCTQYTTTFILHDFILYVLIGTSKRRYLNTKHIQNTVLNSTQQSYTFTERRSHTHK